MTTVSRRTVLLGGGAGLLVAACGRTEAAASLTISAIPDQDPELLNRLYPALAEAFSAALGLEVRYRPVTDYTAVVRAFELGDVHLAWLGGLTGVQARTRVPGATAIAQRDIDTDFRSVFIAHRDTGLEPFEHPAGLQRVAGHSLTFGSETSTSGRLMPQYFLTEAGVEVADLRGAPGYSGSHDATIELVAGGSYQVGAVNDQVWEAARARGTVDDTVIALWRTPGYADYHWVARPDIDATFGDGTLAAVTDLLLGLDSSADEDSEILELFGADRFVPVDWSGRANAPFQVSIQARMSALSARVERCAPRRSFLVVSSANQRSTRFSHEAEVGVKCKRQRGRFTSQSWMSPSSGGMPRMRPKTVVGTARMTSGATIVRADSWTWCQTWAATSGASRDLAGSDTARRAYLGM
jgi:phosphonate transport system substrate-binding protein